MDIHKNACLTPLGRERMVKMVLDGQTLEAVSEAVGVSQRTVRKWVGLNENEGLGGLEDDRCRTRNVTGSPPMCDLPRRRRVSTPRKALSGIVAVWKKAQRLVVQPKSGLRCRSL